VASSPSYRQTSTVNITWTATDATSGIASVRLYVKRPGYGWQGAGLAAQSGTSGTFTYTMAKGYGRYYFATVATDKAGNMEALPTGTGDDNTRYLRANGTLIKKSGTRGVYVILHARKRLIPTAEMFVGLGFDWDDIVTVSSTEFGLYQTGDPLGTAQ
jgi:hypothetical protein